MASPRGWCKRLSTLLLDFIFSESARYVAMVSMIREKFHRGDDRYRSRAGHDSS